LKGRRNGTLAPPEILTEANVQKLVLWMVAACAIAGCGAHGAAVRSYATSDGQRYEDALHEAASAYEAQVADAGSRFYPSDADAFAAARVCTDERWRQTLEASLQRRGLSVRGFELYSAHHPQLATERRRVEREHIAPLQEFAPAIASRVRPDVAWQVEILDDGESVMELASRR
jgi:hypothetical protein